MEEALGLPGARGPTPSQLHRDGHTQIHHRAHGGSSGAYQPASRVLTLCSFTAVSQQTLGSSHTPPGGGGTHTRGDTHTQAYTTRRKSSTQVRVLSAPSSQD